MWSGLATCTNSPVSIVYFCVKFLLFYFIKVPSGYPTNIRAEAYSPTAAILSWTETECSLRNGPINDHEYMLVDMSSGTVHSGTISASTISSASYGSISLLPCVQYKVSMAAVNPAGRGPYSPSILLNVNNESGMCLCIMTSYPTKVQVIQQACIQSGWRCGSEVLGFWGVESNPLNICGNACNNKEEYTLLDHQTPLATPVYIVSS